VCRMCLGGSCWCNSCVATRDKACPICHHLRSFFTAKVRVRVV
jgi:hypothetical protein